MGISVDNNTLYNNVLGNGNSNKTETLEKNLSNLNSKGSNEEDLLEACKGFEQYFVEQVFKEMKKTVHSSDDEGEYMKYFGDMLTEKYAKDITDSGSFGLAQMLYESMKKNNFSES